MDLTIFRTYKDNVVLGRLCNDEKELCKTLELPWKMNTPDISCLPEGVYDFEVRNSPHFGCEVIFILNTGIRENCEIHYGNTVHDILGCVVVGDEYGKLEINGEMLDAVLHSRVTLSNLMGAIGNENGRLTIIEDK